MDLVAVIPGLGALLADILKLECEAEEVHLGTAWTLGACMSGLAQRPSSEWQEKVDVVALTQRIANHEEFVRNGFVLDGLVQLVNAL